MNINILFIILGVIWLIISFIIINFWWNRFTKDTFGLFSLGVSNTAILQPMLDVSGKYAVLKGRLLWRFLIYFVAVGLSFLNSYFVNTITSFIMIMYLIIDFPCIRKTRIELNDSPYAEDIPLHKVFMFYPVFMFICQLVLTLLKLINSIL